MKAFSLFLVTLVTLCSVANSYAANVYFNWGSDLHLDSMYNEKSDVFSVIGVIASDSNQTDQFSLGLEVNGREYRKFFKYNHDLNLLIVRFDIPGHRPVAGDAYDISIKDAQYYEVYTTNPNFGASKYAKNINTKTSITSTFSSGVVQRGMYINSAIPGYRTFIAEPNYNTPIIQRKPNQKIVLPFKDSSFTYKKTNTQQVKFVPKFSHRSHEPSIINGIGNSSNYSSWRVGN